MMKYRIIGHRGWAGAAPENTMASFIKAMEDPRIEAIECDIQLSKDGEVVVIHDFTIDRTSDGKGLVKDHAYGELLQFDFGSWFSPEFAGERIPLLKDVLRLIGGKKRLQIEIKETAGMYPDILDKLLEAIKDYPKETLMIESFNHQLVKKIKEMDPGLCTGIIVHDNTTMLLEELKNTKSNFVSIFFGNVTQDMIDHLNENNIEITLWTLNHKWQLDYIRQFNGSFYIATDYPDLV